QPPIDAQQRQRERREADEQQQPQPDQRGRNLREAFCSFQREIEGKRRRHGGQPVQSRYGLPQSRRDGEGGQTQRNARRRQQSHPDAHRHFRLVRVFRRL